MKLNPDPANILGDKIRMYRQIREMNQIQLAEASGINVGTIRKYELGKKEIEEDDIEEKYKQLDRIALDAAYLEWKITTMASYVSSHEYVTKGFNGIEDIKPGFAQFIW